MSDICLSKRFIGISIAAAALLLSAFMVFSVQAQTSSRNSSISLKKESSGLFTVTIKDSQGIKEFSLKPPAKFSYGGEISNCPTSRKIDNVIFDDPSDFTPFMEGAVVDCKGNRDEFHILPPKDGLTSGARPAAEKSEPAEKATAPTETQPAVSAPTERKEKSVEAPSGKTAGIEYPVAKLGNCKNESDCRTYCENSKNIEACLDFAEEHNLISEKEIKVARKFGGAGFNGPGGCASKDSCEKYCDDINNIDECVAFAEQNDIMPPDELAEAKKVKEALSRGLKTPGGCKSKKECDSYCSNPENMETCINFGESAGFIPPDELADARKVLTAIKKGAKPPPCRGRKQCDAYCSEPENFDMCITFAEEAGMISGDELAQAKQVLTAIKKGAKPPPCRGRKQCDAYCSEPENFEACMDFAAAAGFMSEEELSMARKTGGKGPGNCRGKEECESFCENPDNQEECFNFAEEHGLIPEEDLQEMEEGRAQLQEVLSSAPDEVVECLSGKLGADTVEKLKAGTGMPSRNMEGAMKECFEGMMGGPGGPEGGEGEEGFGPPEGFGGPGGPGGQGKFSGPGGCSSPEECMKFCKENPEECEGFGPPGATKGGPQGGFRNGGPREEGFENGMPPGFEGENGFEKEGEFGMPPSGFDKKRGFEGEGKFGSSFPSGSDIQGMIEKETNKQMQQRMKSFNRPEEFINKEELRMRPQENPVDKLRQYKEGLDKEFFKGNTPPPSSGSQQFVPPQGFEQQFKPPMNEQSSGSFQSQPSTGAYSPQGFQPGTQQSFPPSSSSVSPPSVPSAPSSMPMPSSGGGALPPPTTQ